MCITLYTVHYIVLYVTHSSIHCVVYRPVLSARVFVAYTVANLTAYSTPQIHKQLEWETADWTNSCGPVCAGSGPGFPLQSCLIDMNELQGFMSTHHADGCV